MTDSATVAFMSLESKVMISFRLPADLVQRVDFVAGNLDALTLAQPTRSAVMTAAIEAYLPQAEKRLRDLRILPPIGKK